MSDELDSAYRERNAVVAALFRVGSYRTWRMPAPDAEGWWLVYAETPQGQVSWHVSTADIRLFDDVPDGREPWDGHTTHEKYERVAALAARPDSPTLDVAARAYREAHDLLAVTHTSAQRTVVIERLNDLAKAALAARDEHLAALTRRRP